jgi:hypothetical protein
LALLLLLLLRPWLHVVADNICSNVAAADEQQVPAPKHHRLEPTSCDKLGIMLSASETLDDDVQLLWLTVHRQQHAH